MPGQSARERLMGAAFALFDERGYEHTTVEEIAERAGVSRATFFRTFRSKEDVIFPDHDTMLAEAATRLDGSGRLSPVAAVAQAVRLVLQHYLGEGELAVSRYQLTRTVPALRDREIASTHQYQALFHRYIRGRLGDDPDAALRAELLAVAVVTTHNHVLRRWLRGQSNDPETEFDQALARSVELLREQGGPAGSTSVVVLHTTEDLDALLPRLRTALDGNT
jgi:AcrR family transcriptional regulator